MRSLASDTGNEVMSRRLRVYTDPGVQRPDRPLAPLIHGLCRPEAACGPSTSWEKRYAHWWRSAAEHIELAPLATADVAVLAADWYWIRGASWWSGTDRVVLRQGEAFAEEVRAAGKPLVVFFSGDRSHEKLPLREAIVFREGPYRSRLGPNDHPLPAFSEDLVEHFFEGELPLRAWTPEPSVGFCGLAARRTTLKDRTKLALYHGWLLLKQGWADVSPHLGENLRSEALRRLERAPGLRTNFVIRSEGVFFRNADPKDLVQVRREYVENLAQSDYVLCCRGSGNYSFRLYETLCMGRIPIFIDTDCALPCEPAIDWRASCVWLKEEEIGDIARKVREYHAALTPETFRAQQRRNREVWQQFLAPTGFFSHLARHLGSEARRGGSGARPRAS